MQERGSINKELYYRLKTLQTEDDNTIRNWKMNERFDLEHHALNRHDRRRIKAEYRKKRRHR